MISQLRLLEKGIKFFLWLCAALSVFVTFSIVFSLIFEAIKFFEKIPLLQFLFGTLWDPQVTLGSEIQDDPTRYGFIPLLSGTFLITLIALCVSVPLGLWIAIYTAEYAHPKTRLVLKPIVEILAGIPTIVYGFFAVIAVAPLLRKIASITQMTISSESALGAGLVMGFMIIPFISSLTDDALTSVPDHYRQSSLALGATSSETIKFVILPAAFPNILAAILLALSRAVGETMLVVMAAGLTAQLTFNPLDAVTTVTVQIVNLLTGDQEFNSAKTLSAFALGLTLFIITFALNVIALRTIKYHRKKYGL